ncbi:MAG TPA: chemotaxis protein CheX [Edaphobacter sp.]
MPLKIEYNDWAGRLDSSVSAVFETMLARSCSPTEKMGGIVQPVSAKILFSGAIDGEFVLYASRSVAQVTAEALLGQVAGADDPMIEDAMGELCNMIAGDWKSKLETEQATCAISPPMVSKIDGGAEGLTSGDGFHRFYSFEGNVFGVQMAL